jgi:hypothetical protein
MLKLNDDSASGATALGTMRANKSTSPVRLAIFGLIVLMAGVACSLECFAQNGGQVQVEWPHCNPTTRGLLWPLKVA